VLSFASINLGDSGAFRCVRCHRAGAETLRDTQEVLSAIEAATSTWSSRGMPNLALTGVEPFSHPNLFGILAACVSAGAGRIRLESDACALAASGMAERTLSAGVRHLTFPLLGSSSDRHDGLVGRRGSFEGTVAGVRTFLNAALETGTNVHVVARAPVCRHNLDDAPAMVTLAAELGANAVTLAITDVDLDLRRAEPWLSAACDTGIVCATWVEVEGMPCGRASGWHLHLSSMYRGIPGEKSAACRSCALVRVCSGAIPGASPSVLSTLAPPPDAVETAEKIARSFAPLEVG
jgi:molybdenum cofactor biosynthesis enzyme MoaA